MDDIKFLVGSSVSVLIYLVLNKWGHRYIIIKCVMFSVLTWLLWELVFTLSIEGKTIDIRPISDYYNHLFGTLVFGVAIGLLQKNFIFKTRFFHR